MKQPTCELPECKRRACARKMCQPHYMRWYRSVKGDSMIRPIRKRALPLPARVLKLIKK